MIIQIKNLFKTPFHLKLLNLWCYKWILHYQPDKKTVKVLVYLESIFLILTWFISIPIILNLYLGVLIFRYRIIKKIHYRIGIEFQKKTEIKKHKVFGIFYTIVYLICWFIILSLLFTWIIVILIIIGAKTEKRKEFPKLKKKKKYVYYVSQNEKDKQESKTIGYIND